MPEDRSFQPSSVKSTALRLVSERLFNLRDVSLGVLTRNSGRVTRLLSLLRAHGLIRKVSGTHRYQLTERGRRVITALLAARNAGVDQLTQIAA